MKYAFVYIPSLYIRNMRKQDKQEIKEIIGRTVKELKKIKEVKAVYLFGSQATGKARPYSDIDICVITGKKITKKTKLSILDPSSKRVYIHLFHELPSYIQYRVFRDGRALFVRDNDFVYELRMNTIQSYLDFKPTLDQYHEIVLRRI